jgi:hypothetical protein
MVSGTPENAYTPWPSRWTRPESSALRSIPYVTACSCATPDVNTPPDLAAVAASDCQGGAVSCPQHCASAPRRQAPTRRRSTYRKSRYARVDDRNFREWSGEWSGAAVDELHGFHASGDVRLEEAAHR